MALKMSEKAKKILNIVLTSLEAVVVVVLLIFSVITISSSSTSDNVASVFGTSTFTVLTDSMEPTIKEGSLIFAKKLSEEEKYELKEEEIITFEASLDVDGDGDKELVFNTHKIYKVIPAGEMYEGMSYGTVAYVTKGDKNDLPDPYVVLPTQVVAKYSFHLEGIGDLIYSAKQGNRYFFVIVLPLILLFGLNAYYVVKIVLENQKEKALAINEEEKKKLLEEAKRLALEELRKEQENKNNGGN